MHRLRSPWSASNSLARLAMHRSQSGYASSTVSAPPSALEAVVDTPPTSETPSVHTDAADARDDDAPEPIARPFLHLALLRKITEACIDAASTVPDGAHTALGTPCMLQVGGGLIAVGTTLGATLVFDLSQRLRCVCRARAIEPTHPVVTALALSSDASSARLRVAAARPGRRAPRRGARGDVARGAARVAQQGVLPRVRRRVRRRLPRVDTRLAQLERAHDYLGALHLGLALYHGRGLGSGIGLPRAPAEQRASIAARLDTLQRARRARCLRRPTCTTTRRPRAAPWPRVCAAIATATHDVAWLFDELYTLYETHGAESVFVHEMEPFIVHGEMPTPAPGVLQRLLAFRARTGDLDRVTQLVLHVDPWHLDLDQTLSLCRRHRLWDAYISVSLRALHDALTPARLLLERVHAALRGDDDARDAYTLYAFLASTARGVLHPTDAPLDDAPRAAAAAVFPWVLRAPAAAHRRSTRCSRSTPRRSSTRSTSRSKAKLFDEDRAARARADAPRLGRRALGGARAPRAERCRVRRAFVQLRADEVRAVFATLTRPTSSPAPADCELGLECLFSAYALPWDDAEVRAALRTAQYWRVYEYALRKAHDLDALLRFFLTDEDGEHHTPGQLYSRVAQLAPWPAFGARLRPALLDALADVPDSLLGDVAHIATRFAPHDTLDLLAALADAPQRQYLYLAPFFPLDARTEPRAELKRAWVALVAHFCPATLATHLEARAPAFFDLAQVVDAVCTMALPRPDDPLPPLTGLRSWWSSFARAAPSPREERSADDTSMFGAPLPEALKQSSVAISLINQDGEQYVWGYVPAVVAKIGLFLKQHATDVEGVFRINGSEKRMKELRTQFDTPPEYGKDIDWDGYNVHDAATILRRFLNLMPEPVIPADRFVEFREVLAKPAVDEEEAIGAYRKLITSCPPATQYLLLYLLDLLAVFERNAEVNKMTANNLAILFQPGMLMHPSVRTKEDHQAAVRVVEFLITHQDRFVLDVSDLPPADMLPEELTRPKTKAALEKYLLVPSDSDEDLGDLEAHMGGGAMLARSAPNSRTMFQRKGRRPRRERRRSSSQDVSPPAAAAPSPAAAPDRKDTTRTKPSVCARARTHARARADEAPLRAAAPIPYATTRAAVRPSSPPPAVLPPHSFDLHHAKVMYTISGPKHKS
ncbi:SAC7 [Malassezia furfur]|nr:SAC7 [Malassezia furfur]